MTQLVFLDESGVHISMTRTFARARSGTRVGGKVPRNRGNALTILGAMRANGEMVTATIDTGISGPVFEAYTRTQLSAFLRKGDILVMDNLGAHKCASIRKILSDLGVHIHWLPPYTPEANPIEMFWGWMKRRLRDAGARTRQALDEAIVSAVDALTPSIPSAWIRNGGYRNLLG